MQLESKVEGLVLEEWMLAAIYAVQSIAADQNKHVEFKFSDLGRGWLRMRIYKGDELKLDLRVPKRVPASEIIEESGTVIQLPRTA